jgi:hypothetical protein
MNLVPLLAVGQAFLAAMLFLVAGLPVRIRHRAIQFASTVGLASAVALYAVDDRWRTVDLGRPEARIAAVGVGAAWLLVLVGERRRGDWRTAALVGCASTGLLLAAPNRWLVPMLIFWSAGTFAIMLSLRDARPASLGWFALIAGDGLLIAALIGAAQDSGTWFRPEGMDGWHLWAASAGTILRAGVIPLSGVWGALETDAGPILPLVVAGAFALPMPSLAAQPWVSAMLLGAALWLAGWSLLHRGLRIGIVAAWPVCLGLATAFAASRAEGAAGVQATLACAAVALWPATLGRGQVERGILISFLPLTAGFAAVGLASGAAFETASPISGLDFLPWAILVGLLPLAQLAGVLLAARTGAEAEPERFEPAAVLALWSLLAASVTVSIVAPQGVGEPHVGGRWLQIGALAGAVGAAVAMRRSRPPSAEPAPPPLAYRRSIIEPRPVIDRSVAWAAGLIALVTLATLMWFVVDGLRLGFLPQ